MLQLDNQTKLFSMEAITPLRGSTHALLHTRQNDSSSRLTAVDAVQIAKESSTDRLIIKDGHSFEFGLSSGGH